MSTDDACGLCGGTGEVELLDRRNVGCPACIEADRDRLAEIVERLPKTADGLRVVAGDSVFCDFNGVIRELKVAGDVNELWHARDESCRMADVDCCYSTRDAAEGGE